MLKSFLREPLVHFLLLGAALFAADAWLRPTSAPAKEAQIVVGEARIRTIAQNFQRTWQRPPTREELEGLIQSHVREEVLYREALSLGLDRDDAIIRRRLQQKMEFVSEEAAALAAPTDEELAAYLTKHADAFAVEPRVAFEQVYLDPAKRAATLDADVKRLLATLNAADTAAAGPARRASADPARLGDPLMLLEPRYENLSKTELARLFGNEFADALVKQPVGRWVGPIRSGYGVHVVKLDALQPGGAPSLADVRPLVEREWKNAKRKELGEAFYAKLRAKYTVTVQPYGAATPGTATSGTATSGAATPGAATSGAVAPGAPKK